MHFRNLHHKRKKVYVHFHRLWWQAKMLHTLLHVPMTQHYDKLYSNWYDHKYSSRLLITNTNKQSEKFIVPLWTFSESNTTETKKLETATCRYRGWGMFLTANNGEIFTGIDIHFTARGAARFGLCKGHPLARPGFHSSFFLGQLCHLLNQIDRRWLRSARPFANVIHHPSSLYCWLVFVDQIWGIVKGKYIHPQTAAFSHDTSLVLSTISSLINNRPQNKGDWPNEGDLTWPWQFSHSWCP